MKLTILVIIILVICVVVYLCKGSKRDGYGNVLYQYYPEGLNQEDYYFTCINNMCNGNTHDYDCMERCHLMTFRKGMKKPDIQDWVCYHYRGDPHAYYRCLNAVYADLKYP